MDLTSWDCFCYRHNAHSRSDHPIRSYGRSIPHDQDVSMYSLVRGLDKISISQE